MRVAVLVDVAGSCGSEGGSSIAAGAEAGEGGDARPAVGDASSTKVTSAANADVVVTVFDTLSRSAHPRLDYLSPTPGAGNR